MEYSHKLILRAVRTAPKKLSGILSKNSLISIISSVLKFDNVRFPKYLNARLGTSGYFKVW